jgi:hypothetical protein
MGTLNGLVRGIKTWLDQMSEDSAYQSQGPNPELSHRFPVFLIDGIPETK